MKKIAILLLLGLVGCISNPPDEKWLEEKCVSKCEKNDGFRNSFVPQYGDCQCKNGAKFIFEEYGTYRCQSLCKSNGGIEEPYVMAPIWYFCRCKNGAIFSDTMWWN